MGEPFRLALSFVLVIVIFMAGIMSYHWYKGASPGDAVAMTSDDVRLAINCPHYPPMVWRFVQRDPPKGDPVRMEERAGVDWARLICSGVTTTTSHGPR